MLGRYFRAGLTIGVAVLAAGILEFIIPFFLPYQGPETSMLYRSFDFLAENALFLMLLAIGAGVLARAVVESGPGGV